MADRVLFGAGEDDGVLLRYANRHGLIAGATGTGKTVTLQTLAQGFSDAGVPVFLADVKGDLAGIAAPGSLTPRFAERLQLLKLPPPTFRAAPALFWDLFAQQGHPVRTTVSEMGPVLLARLLELNDTQEGVLNLAFRVADEEGLLILDMADLRAVLAHVADRAAELATRYGNVSKSSVGAIQRQLLLLEQQGADRFFGEPALDLADLMRTAPDGRGAVSVLAADKLMAAPRTYATFLLWLLAELFEDLPELGDVDKPRLVFFFDEAHLLFDGAPKALIDQVEQVIRLIRSKGVGVWFVTQNPLDVPETVLGQLGNRVQHALRAFTPKDQKAVRAAADTFRPSPGLDTATAITELGVGEALVSVLDAKGTPTPVRRVLIRPPVSRIGPLTADERASLIKASPLAGHYDQTVDRESAYERLTQRAETPRADEAPASPWGNAGAGTSPTSPWGDAAAPAGTGQSGTGQWGSTAPQRRPPLPPSPQAPRPAPAPRPSNRQSMGEAIAKSMARSVTSAIGSRLGRELVRGVLGSLLKGR